MGYYQSQAAEQSKTIATGKGYLGALTVLNAGPAMRYVYVFDSLTPTGTLLVGPLPVAPEQSVSLAFDSDEPMPFTTGLTVASSSALAPFGASGTNDLFITAHHRPRS